MLFYLIEIATGDKKVAGKAVYEFETLNEAIAAFHTNMGKAMKSDLYDSDLLIVSNSLGGIYKNESYKKPVPEPEEPIQEPIKEEEK